jgi:hypothetical protein
MAFSFVMVFTSVCPPFHIHIFCSGFNLPIPAEPQRGRYRFNKTGVIYEDLPPGRQEMFAK